jgi:hypothetical protein
MTFQQFLSEIKRGTLHRLLEEYAQRHENFPSSAIPLKGFFPSAAPSNSPSP